MLSADKRKMSQKVGLPPEPEAGLASVRGHLRELLESSAFKGSRRGQQFLQYVVDRTLDGQLDDLKERSLGVALFGRAPDYDTGEDAIVRVTASDVRKRLHQYYSENGSAIRIELPPGSYAPEFRVVPSSEAEPPMPPDFSTADTGTAPRRLNWPLAGALVAVLAVSGALLYRGYLASDRLSPLNVLPWSVLLRDGRQVQLVLADPDVPAMEALIGSRISLSDYANRRYISNPDSFGPDMQRAFTLLRGVNVAAVDVGIALDVSRLAGANSARLKTHTARSLQMGSLKTDDHFILLGSPHSNPWGELFKDYLDFEFVRDSASNLEMIRNKNAQSGERAAYLPTAGGWGTGHAFAIIALISNPGQSGKVLLLAGTNAEGTEAAGRFAVNPAEMARALQAHAIDPGGEPCDFEILLQVRTMAGSPSKVEVVSCHRLRGMPQP